MNVRRLPVFTIATLSMVVLAGAFLSAQEVRGTILGRITDPSGAVVPGASITAINEATNVKVEAVSNDEGNYTLPFLLPGRYTVSAELPGFKKSVRKGIIVQVQDKVPSTLRCRCVKPMNRSASVRRARCCRRPTPISARS